MPVEKTVPPTFDELRQSCDAIVVTTLQNVRYLSGFTGSNAVLLLMRGNAMTVFTDPRYAIQARRETKAKVKIVRRELIPALEAHLAKSKLVGFENRRITFAAAEGLQKLLKLGASLVGLDSAIEEKRMVKTAEEIALIR